MVKRIRTLLTLFLLVMGTTMSWAEFKDFSLILDNSSETLLTSGELATQWTPFSFGVSVDEKGNVTRVSAGDASSVATISGKSHGEHGAAYPTLVVPVDGSVKITIARCSFSKKDYVVTDSKGNVVASAAPVLECWKDDHSRVTELLYEGGATTLTISGMEYCAYIAVEKIKKFKDFSLILDNSSETLLTSGELATQWTPFSFGVSVDEKGNVTRVPVGDASSVATISGKSHGEHGAAYPTLVVPVDGSVKITIARCSFSKKDYVVTDSKGNVVASAAPVLECWKDDHSRVTELFYEGDATTLTISGMEYCAYIAVEKSVGVEYNSETNTYVVAANNAKQLLEALSRANKTGNVSIYLPNGTYDLGTDINTEVKADNIAIIGESRDGVIIKNTPEQEGLDKTATLKNSSTGLYLQDLTIQCYAPYDTKEKAERGVALWDQGTKTICKNVYLKGIQDTYYSNGAEGMIAYFEGGKIEGAIDFICGSGNVLFNSVTLNVVKNEHSGNVIAAPSTYPSEFGYLFANCHVTANDGYFLARGWQAHETASPAFTFIVTDVKYQPNVDWDESIMAPKEYGYPAILTRRFAAYRFSLKTEQVQILKMDKDADPKVVTKSNLRTFAGDWDPAAIISQHKPIKTNGAGWASYTAFTDVQLNGDGVKAYAAKEINAKSVTLVSVDDNKISAGTPVFIYGAKNSKYYVEGTSGAVTPKTNLLKPVLFDTTLEDGSNAFVLGTRGGVCGLYSVNSTIKVPAGKCYLDATGYTLALAKDQLELVFVEEETTGIDNVVAGSDDNATRYNLAGQKVGNDYKGIVIKGGKKYLAK